MTDANDNDVEFDATQHQTSYIFTPPTSSLSERPNPAKRVKKSLPVSTNDGGGKVTFPAQFPALLNGQESQRCVDLRKQLFLSSWKRVETEIENIVSHANQTTLDAIAGFIDRSQSPGREYQIPAALIVTGPNIASQQLLFSQIAERLQTGTLDLVVTITSGDAINLKSALKKIIRDATNQDFVDENDEDDDLFDREQHSSNDRDRLGRKLLSYDLEILHKFVKAKACGKVVVAFQDCEAFDVSIMSQLIELFSSWLDRMPLAVLFGIATSVELFQERLPRKTIRLLHGEQFGVEPTDSTLQTIFRQVVVRDSTVLWFGRDFVQALLERQEDHVESLQTFISSLKYAYMCHFYANPLSVFLCDEKDFSDVSKILQPEHLEAVRMLESFQMFVLTLLKAGDIDHAQLLLTSDDHLLAAIQQSLRRDAQDQEPEETLLATDGNGPSRSRTIMTADLARLDCFLDILQATQRDGHRYTDLFLQLHTDAFNDTTIVSDAVDVFRYMNGAELASVMDMVIRGLLEKKSPRDTLVVALNSLNSLIHSRYGTASKSTYMLEKYQPKSLRTTVVAQKVLLSEQATSVSDEDLAEAKKYTELVDGIVEILEDYLVFTQPSSLPFHELFVFNSRTPNRQVFTPKPRQAVEQALSVPHAYLDCDCCHPSQESLASTNPPTAILYKLYLETGGLINVFDLWSAFYTILGGEDGEDCTERMGFMLFYHALAELKLMGMLKQSRKKVDHLAKTTWMGL